MGDAGIEHPPLVLSKTPISKDPRTESGTLSAGIGGSSPDSDLQLIIRRWPDLAPEVRAAIARMAKSK